MSSIMFSEELGPPSSQEIPSSPPRASNSPPRRSLRRERRDPSITPRKFRRFFTPRSLEGPQLRSRMIFNDITAPALNRNTMSSPLRPGRGSGMESSPVEFTRDLKRRKLFHTPETSPEKVGLNKEPGIVGVHNSELGEGAILSSPCARYEPEDMPIDEEEEALPKPVKRIVRLKDRGLASQFLGMKLNCSPHSGRLRSEYPVNDWLDHTASFYSKPEDVHMSMSIEGGDRTIPFCAASCNTNSLVAVGDEEGRVRLLESAKDPKPPFAQTYLSFRVHGNAIIDMIFSPDDQFLATASGDQSARIVDMTTQTTISILGNHTASLKQVKFQPGTSNNSVIATSSRDGSIQIWDLRVNPYSGPLNQIYVPLDPGRPYTRLESSKTQYARAVNSIQDAHKPQTRQTPSIAVDYPSRGEAAGRLGDVSVTAIEFLSAELPHLLLSASEADSSVKLWDIRSLPAKKKNVSQLPISSTAQPQSHSKWRHFGVSSLNLSSDGKRMYTLCKDNTVYAYSTAHLVLGSAPELSLTTPSRPGVLKSTQEGLGPLYGFRHPQLHATSFYVKSAIRKARNGKAEMLAVGSSDGCAILFPTDERYLFSKSSASTSSSHPETETSMFPFQRPSLRRIGSGLTSQARIEDTIPISTNGTPLIRGHDREVGSLTWTSEGNLVTVGDDFLIRCWREGDNRGSEARDLRIGGERDGRRWGCGWADLPVEYDQDE